MKKLQVMVAGYGNVGRSALAALSHAEDMEAVVLLRRQAKRPPELAEHVKVIADIEEASDLDLAVLSVPTRLVREYALELLPRGISTVDSVDTHGDLMWQHVQELERAALAGGACAITAAGWDPGTDSAFRALLRVIAPRARSHTNFGPGLSLGHGVACRSKKGVKDAISVTIPVGGGIHRREVYVELEPGVNLEEVAESIKTDPYFIHDDTIVRAVDDVRELEDLGHGVLIEHHGASADAHNTVAEFRLRGTNPGMTAQIMVNAGRAVTKLRPGAYTFPEIPPLYMLPGSREYLIKELV